MTAVVTGGNGFIGRHLVAQLLARGEAVRVLDLSIPQEHPAGADFIRGSVTDATAVRRALDGARSVYHLAANAQLWSPRKGEFDAVNHQGTRIVLDEAARAGVHKLVHTSSLTTLIGRRNGREDTVVDETVELGEDDMLGDYCLAKHRAEGAALAAAREGLPVTIVVPTLPIGPGDRGLTPPSRMILDFVNGASPAYLDCTLNLIDVRDVAAGHLAAHDHGQPGRRYILGNENLGLRDLLGLIQEITGLAMPGRRVPFALAYGVAVVTEWVADVVTKRVPKAPLTGVRLARPVARFDASRAVSELSLPQNPVRGALRDAILWMVEAGLVTRALPGLRAEVGEAAA